MSYVSYRVGPRPTYENWREALDYLKGKIDPEFFEILEVKFSLGFFPATDSWETIYQELIERGVPEVWAKIACGAP